jgi:hypothetical protein
MSDKPRPILPRVSMPKGDKAEHEYANISKLVLYISTTSGLVDKDEPFKLVTMPSKNASVTVALKSDADIRLSQNITQYDAAVMDSVYSLYENGCQFFSPEMVARMISGNLKGRVSAQKIGSVTRSINKLRHIDITIDMTDEYLKTGRSLDPDVRITQKSYLLPVDEYGAVIPDNGKTTKSKKMICKDADGNEETIEIVAGYQFIKKPVLYTYAEQNGEIERFPTKLLDAPAISDTDENTAIKWYLIRRIGMLKKAKNKAGLKDIIYYDQEEKQGAFSDLWYDEKAYSNWRDKRAKIHRAIVDVLEAYKEESYIKDYKPLLEGKTVIGVEIFIESDN